MGAALMLLSALTACGAPEAEPSASDLDNTGPDSQGEVDPPKTPAVSEGEQAARTAYCAALEGVYYDRVLPEDWDFDTEMDPAEHRFAVLDVDGDGAEELLLICEARFTAGRSAMLFGYDSKTDTLQPEFSSYPLVTFYDNGIIQAMWSHNQGLAGEDFWPYDLYQYDAETDTYAFVAMVDAWDGNYWDETYVMEPFPEDVDADGDRIIYYVMQNYDYDRSNMMDGPDYEAWLAGYTGGAQEIELPLLRVTEENIAALA